MWMWRCAQHHKVCTMMDKEGFQGKYDFLYLPIAPRLMLLGTGIQCCPDQMLALRTSAPKPVWATPLSISSMKRRQWFFWLVALDLCAMRKAFLKSCINLMRLLLDFFSRPRNFGRLLMATQNGCCQVPRWEGFRFLISWLRAWQQWDLAPYSTGVIWYLLLTILFAQAEPFDLRSSPPCLAKWHGYWILVDLDDLVGLLN